MAAPYLAHVLAVAATYFGGGAAQPLPDSRAGYVDALRDVVPRLQGEAKAWDGTGDVPAALAADSLYEQRLVLEVAGSKPLRAYVVPRVGSAAVRDEVQAQVLLSTLSAGYPARKHYGSGPAQPAATLSRYYRAAEKRFKVSPALLAAVNFVETDFNRLQNDSQAGAQGPMQFIPATWKAYGMGGDVRDPHDAIMGAANYLHANGAPGDESGALYHYNPSLLYVKAVLRYEKRMRSTAGFHALFARSLMVRTPGGGRRVLTGPDVEQP